MKVTALCNIRLVGCNYSHVHAETAPREIPVFKVQL
jgi:hypothetical protein